MSEVDFKSLAKEMSGKQKSSSSILLLSIISLLALILLWAASTDLDNVTRGDGKTISSSNQLVQSSEPGVLRRGILMKETLFLKEQFYLTLIQ